MNNLENELKKTLKTEPGFDSGQSETKTKEIAQMYDKTMKKYKIEFYLRFAVAMAVLFAGMAGMRHNTGRYIYFGLFMALVGFNSIIMLILWYQHRIARLETLKEIKRLQLQIAELAEKDSSTEN